MAVDGSHYYMRDGSPLYEVEKKDGSGMRNVNLRWDKNLNPVPSVTTVGNIEDKPALTEWKIEQAILAALTLPRQPGESDEDYVARVKADAKQQAIDAADEGTRIHDAIEASFKGEGVPGQYAPHVAAVRAELARAFPRIFDWEAERTFAHPMGYGGKIDLCSPSTGVVVDYKSKDGPLMIERDHVYALLTVDGEVKKKRCDFDQNVQLGAYQFGAKLPNAPGASIFVSRTHPGEAKLYVWTPQKMVDGYNHFCKQLALWCSKKKYDPSF